MCDPFARNTNLIRPFTKKKKSPTLFISSVSFDQSRTTNCTLAFCRLLFHAWIWNFRTNTVQCHCTRTCFIAKFVSSPKISHFPFIYVPNHLSIQDIPRRINEWMNEWMSLNQPRQNTNDYYDQSLLFFVSHLAKITKLLYLKIERAIKNCSLYNVFMIHVLPQLLNIVQCH